MQSENNYDGVAMGSFVTTVMKTRKGVYYFNIPQETLKKFNLKPFMAGRMKADKKRIVLSDFEKTVKIKVDLKKKDIERIKKIIDNSTGLSDEEYLIKRDGRQTKLIHMHTRETIADEGKLKEYRDGLNVKLEQIERRKLKAWQLVGR